jgi:hypothetical protein
MTETLKELKAAYAAADAAYAAALRDKVSE